MSDYNKEFRTKFVKDIGIMLTVMAIASIIGIIILAFL